MLDDYGQVAGTVEIFHAWMEMGQDGTGCICAALRDEKEKPRKIPYVLPGGVE